MAPDGTVYLADGAHRLVWRVDRSGRAEPFYQPSPAAGEAWVALGLAVDEAGVPLLDSLFVGERSYRREVRRLGEEAGGQLVVATAVVSEAGPAAEVGEAARGEELALSPDGSLYLLSREDAGFSLSIRRFRATGEPAGRITLRSREAIGRASLVGADSRGTVYLGLDLGSPGGRILAVDGRGRAAWTLPLPSPPGAPRLGTYAVADRSGNLVVLTPGPDGLAITVYRRSRTWAFGR